MERGKTLKRIQPWLLWSVILIGAVFVIKTKILTPPRIEIDTVVARDLTAQVYGNGTVEAKVMLAISSKITGRIIEIFADQGDQVTKGQLLTRLEDTDFIQQERQAQAALNKAEATRAVEETTLRKAQATLTLAEKNAQRFADLANKDLIAHLEFEQYQTASAVALEEVARSKAALQVIHMEEQLNQASLDLSRSRLADTRIFAPQDGVIISRNLEQGATVTLGLPIFTMADPQMIWVKANVDEALLGGVAVGKKAAITLRSDQNTSRPGEVVRLGRQSDRVTEELEVNVAFTPPLASYRLGEQADVLILAERKDGVPSLRATALISRANDRGVWRISQDELQFTKVQTGIEDRQGFTEIISGLTHGDQVALAPPAEMAKFKDGMKVRSQ
ncbi:MAG: efflux RND transporter periplasmic adaptor subunit [Proteobacteria bacterium]|nr:efflux RND transporter periplasmic adaptor subunit [Desulfobulbaceae bacterium]MBU4151573.1 efflux RND transporter periplasmic adaptor subunit [Pseudomonadota bacterium]